MTSMRVVLADDHTLFRAGLRALLEKLPDVQVVAEARDGYEAVHMVETHHPDLVLMDIAMPGLNGLEATRRVSTASIRRRDCSRVRRFRKLSSLSSTRPHFSRSPRMAKGTRSSGLWMSTPTISARIAPVNRLFCEPLTRGTSAASCTIVTGCLLEIRPVRP